MYQSQPGADDVCWVDVSLCADAQLGAELSREAALAKLHMRRNDGTLVCGAQAFVDLWLALPRWAWLGRLAGAGPIVWLLDRCYGVFLRMRRLWRQAPRGSQ